MGDSSDTILVIVCDAGPIIHLDELGCINLLTDFPKILLPEAVWEEVERHRPKALQGLTTAERKAAPPSCSATLEALGRVLTLHRGEQEALCLAEVTPGCLLLTDDAAARLAARNLGLPVHGTLGMLIRAIRRQQKTKEEILVILRALPQRSTLHLRSRLLEEIIQQIDSESP